MQDLPCLAACLCALLRMHEGILQTNDKLPWLMFMRELQAMCRYADGKNAETGVDTRSSLGCGSRRKFSSASPSSSEGPQVTDSQKKDFVQSMPVYRH